MIVVVFEIFRRTRTQALLDDEQMTGESIEKILVEGYPQLAPVDLLQLAGTAI